MHLRVKEWSLGGLWPDVPTPRLPNAPRQGVGLPQGSQSPVGEGEASRGRELEGELAPHIPPSIAAV